MDKFKCSVVGTTVVMIILYLPLLHNLIKENIGETIALWNSKGIEVCSANNLVWLFYGVVKLEKHKTKELILGTLGVVQLISLSACHIKRVSIENFLFPSLFRANQSFTLYFFQRMFHVCLRDAMCENIFRCGAMCHWSISPVLGGNDGRTSCAKTYLGT